MSWDELLAEDFLQEYRKYECLWNPFHRQFHDCFAKGEALKKIVKNLPLRVGVQDCLRLVKCIREKYVGDQAKNLVTIRSSLCQPKWMQIVECMLEKIACDEDSKSNYLAPLRIGKSTVPAVNILFRRTISSKRRKYSSNPKQKKRRRSIKCKRQQGKLERRGKCCNNNAEKNMDPCRAAQDCSRPQTNWRKQRDDYLDQLAWTKSTSKPIEYPGLASHIERVSRIENVGKDLCSSTPVYTCPNRTTHVHCNQSNHGRRRHTDIHPTITESRSCRSPPPAARPATPCSPRKPSPERTSCPSAKKEKKTSARSPSPVQEKCAIDKKDDVCTRDSCPSYSQLKTNDAKSACCDVKSESPADRSVRFDACSTPRVAAKFENGVLEACSRFKVVFPSSQDDRQSNSSNVQRKCCAQKVQTDGTTRERAVGASSREFLRGNRANKCPRTKDTSTGTDADLIECNETLEPDDTCHDYVLLTPGGKYVPLVRTKSETTNERDDECACCSAETDKNQGQDFCEDRSEQNCAKQHVTLDDDKRPSNTTKLLLRCLEHILNLEEHQSMTKATDTSDDGCQSCCRKERRDQQLAANPSSSCLPCLEERLAKGSTRGKLTQNLLQILKCAMELDCNKKTDEDEDACRCCDHRRRESVTTMASSTPNSTCSLATDARRKCPNSDKIVRNKVSTRDTAVGNNADTGRSVAEKVTLVSKTVQCEAKKRPDQRAKNDALLDNLARRADIPERKTADNLSIPLKCDDDDDDDEPIVTRVPATTLPRAQIGQANQRDKEHFDKGKVKYVKCNQIYKSYVVKSPTTTMTGTSQTRYYR